MPEKISLQIPVDIDLTAGSIEAKKLAAEVDKQVKKLASDLSTKNKIPLEFDLQSIRGSLAKAKEPLQAELSAALKSLGAGTKGGNLAETLRLQIKSATDILDKDGKIVRDKLRGLLEGLAKQTGAKGGLSDSKGTSELKRFLVLEGLTLEEATARLSKASKQYEKTKKELVASVSQQPAFISVDKVNSDLATLEKSIAKKEDLARRDAEVNKRILGGFASRVTFTKKAFDLSTSEGSKASEAVKASDTKAYTEALRKNIVALELAKDEGSALGVVDSDLNARLASLRSALERVNPEVFRYTQNLRDAGTETSLDTKLITKLSGELDKQRTALRNAETKVQVQAPNTKASVDALDKQIAATKLLRDTQAQVDVAQSTSAYAESNVQLGRTLALLQQRRDLEQAALDLKKAQNNSDKQSEETSRRKLAGLAGRVTTTERTFKAVTSDESTESAAVKSSATKAYTEALRKNIIELELARDSAKALGLVESEIDSRLAHLRNELERVNPEVFRYTQNLRDAGTEVSLDTKLVTKLTGELDKQKTVLALASSKTAVQVPNTAASVEALEKQIQATKSLRDTQAQIDKAKGASEFVEENRQLDLTISKLQERLHLEQDTLAVKKAETVESKRTRAEETKGTPEAQLEVAKTRVSAALTRVQDARALTQSITDTNPPASEHLKALNRLKTAEEKLLTEYQNLKLAAERVFKSTGRAIDPSITQNIVAQQKAIAALSQEIAGMDTLWVQASRAIQLFFRYVIGFGALYKLASAISTVVTETLALQHALIGIKAVTGTTDTQLKIVSASIKEVAQSTSFSVSEVAKGGQTLVQAGVLVEEFGKTLKATANLASATNSGFEETAQIITTFKDVFKDLAPEDIADQLRNAVNISKLSLSDLGTIANYLLETSDSVNISLKEVLAASATLRNAGIKASTIGTGLRQGILELFSPDKKVLEGLQARYRALGQNLSKETVKAMFQGFENSKTPLLSALNELEKLGVGTTGDNEFSRIIDVRGENAIKTLVRNKDALIANAVGIEQAGTAAAGAKTQLESLTNSFQNLAEGITITIADASEGFIRRLVSMTQAVTAWVDSFRKALNDLKAETGSTGLGDSILAGSGALVTAVAAKFSLFRSLGFGLLVGLAEETSKVYGAANKAVSAFGDALLGLSAILATNVVFKGLTKAAKAVPGAVGAVVGGVVGTLGVKATTQVTEQAVARETLRASAGIPSAAAAATGVLVGISDKLKGVLPKVVSLGKALLTSWGLWLTIGYEALDYFFDFFDKAKESQAAKSEAISAQIESLRKDQALSEAAKVAEKSSQEQLAALAASVEAMNGAVASFSQASGKTQEASEIIKKLGDSTNGLASVSLDQRKALEARLGEVTKDLLQAPDKIRKIMEASATGTLAVGSEALEKVAEQIAQIQGVTSSSIDRFQLSGALQKIDTAIKQAEAVRKQYIEELNKAYSDLAANPDNLDAKAVVEAAESLSESEQAFLRTVTVDADSAKKILSLKGSAGSLKKAIQKVAEAVNPEILAKKIEALALSAELAVTAGGEPAGVKAVSELKLAIGEAIDRGETAVLEGLKARLALDLSSTLGSAKTVDFIKGIVPKAAIEASKANNLEQILKPFKQAVKESTDQVKAIEVQPPSIENFEVDFARRQADLQADNAKAQTQRKLVEDSLRVKQGEFQQFATQAQAELEADPANAELNKRLTLDLLTKKKELSDLNDSLVGLKQEEVSGEETLKAAQQGFVVGQNKLKALQDQLQVVHGAKLHSSETELGLIEQIHAIESEQLAAEKEILAKTLASVVDKEKLFITAGVSPDSLLKAFSGKLGQQALVNSEELSNAYKALADVVSREKGLREKYLTDLDNVQRKELETSRDKAKSELDKQSARTVSLEHNLQTATNKLTEARQKLADSYRKAAELEDFFASTIREIEGKDLTSSDVKKTLDEAAFTGDVELAKKASEDAKGLFADKKIGKSEAISLVEQAREVALQAQNVEIQRNTEQVQSLEAQASQLRLTMEESVRAEAGLKESLERLNASITQLTQATEARKLQVDDLPKPDEGQKEVNVLTEAPTTPTENFAVFPEDKEINSIQGFAEGGLVGGSGSKDNIPIYATPQEFMQPVRAVRTYGVEFMEKVRNLKIDPSLAREVASIPTGSVSRPDKPITNTLQPVTFNVGGNIIKTMAEPDAVSQFQAGVRLQAMKSGRKTL